MKTAQVKYLKAGDVINCGETVKSVTPSAEYEGRCYLRTDKCGYACNLTDTVPIEDIA